MANYTMTIAGLYNWDESLFDAMEFPKMQISRISLIR